jgi:hypothetical protein
MVEAAPTPPLKMSQAELLFQLLVIALDNPALLGQSHEIVEFGIDRQGRQPILSRFGVSLGPLD